MILSCFATVPSRRTIVVLEHDGDGVMGRVGEGETAFGHRGWPYNLLVTSAWADAAESEANLRWTQEFWEAMRPFLANAVYVNDLGAEVEERVRAACGAAKHERLDALKRNYDPANLFRLNQNIRPAAWRPLAVARPQAALSRCRSDPATLRLHDPWKGNDSD